MPKSGKMSDVVTQKKKENKTKQNDINVLYIKVPV